MQNNLPEFNKQRKAKKRATIIAICIFALLFSSSAVYAFATKQIEFNGRAMLAPSVKLELYDVNFTDTMRVGETVAVKPGTDNSVIIFQSALTTPGDSRTISFRIKNTGNMAATVVGVLIENPLAEKGIIAELPENLTNFLSLPNTTSELFSVTITWDPSFPEIRSGNYNFGATIDYVQN